MTDISQNTVLQVKALSKSFTSVKAVNNISFTIGQGDIFAFLGPNGAGKTTTLRILLDIIKSDGGQIEWNLDGKPGPVPEAEQIGYLPEERGLYLDIPVLRSLVYLATIRGMDPADAKRSAMNWLERLELADRAKDKLQVLSKGNQQKIQFIAAILHKPAFAILDEPFSGLDPLNQEKFIDFIREINGQGTTILLSAHQMALVEKLAGKIFLIHNGQELYNGSLSGIYNEFGKKHILELQLKPMIRESAFQNLPGIEQVDPLDDQRVKLTLGQETDINGVLSELSKIPGITGLSSRKPDLHEIFLQLVKSHRP